MLDLKKTLELIDHSIFIEKLANYNFDSVALNWFESYVKERSQIVSFRGELSSKVTSVAVVPQGSINVSRNPPGEVNHELKMALSETTIFAKTIK